MEIKPKSQSRSWNRTEKMAENQSRSDFASTLQSRCNQWDKKKAIITYTDLATCCF